MKPKNFQWLSLAGLAFATFIFSSWQVNGGGLPIQPYLYASDQDTTPVPKSNKGDRTYTIREIDNAIREIDRASLEMDKQMKMDFSKMEKNMQEAMAEIKKIDFAKIQRDVKASLKEVNWDEINKEVSIAMQEAKKKFREVDMKKIEQELEKAKADISQEKIRSSIDMAKIRESVENSLAAAKEGIKKAKKELSMLKEFTDNLEKDGLISKEKGYKIEIKNGEMYLNGTLQSKEINDKYRKYFTEKDFSIRSDGKERTSL